MPAKRTVSLFRITIEPDVLGEEMRECEQK